MDDITEPLANNISGEDNTQVAEPTTETNTEDPSGKVSEDSNHSNGRPETVPYDIFAKERRERAKDREKIAELEKLVNMASTPAGNGAPMSEAGIPQEFIDEEGVVDINRYTEWMRQSIPSADDISKKVLRDMELREKTRELRAKEEAELLARYPEAKDPDKRQLIDAIKNQSLISGNYKSLLESADSLFNISKKVAEDTRRQVTETIEIQSNVASPSPTSGKINQEEAQLTELREKMQDSNKKVRDAARIQYLKVQQANKK